MSSPTHPTPPGTESVWDYPRPPRLEPTPRNLRVELAGAMIADTRHGLRVLETSHPPVYYFPPSDVDTDVLVASPRRSWCEWKGEARYYTLVVPGRSVKDAAWYYPQPLETYARLASFVAFYPNAVDACYVDDERVVPQPGDFYGGWITRDVAGPFKGSAGTAGW